MKSCLPDGELVDHIYAAVLGQATWQAFVDRLAAGMPDGKTTLFFHDAIRAKGAFALTFGQSRPPTFHVS